MASWDVIDALCKCKKLQMEKVDGLGMAELNQLYVISRKIFGPREGTAEVNKKPP